MDISLGTEILIKLDLLQKRVEFLEYQLDTYKQPMTVSAHAKKYGINACTVRKRMKQGINPKKLISKRY